MRVRLWPIEARLFLIAPFFSHAILACIVTLAASYAMVVHEKTERAAMCLAENIYHESRGEKPSDKYVLGMLTLARVADPSPQWPKTICGAVAQQNQFSWVLDYKLATDRSEQKKWDEAKHIAYDLIENAWVHYALPKGWECARWYKRTDGKDVSKASMKFFDTRLFPVGSFGHHTAFQERHGCKNPLPTN